MKVITIAILSLFINANSNKYHVVGKLQNSAGLNLYGIKITYLDKVAYSDFDGGFKIELPKENEVQVDFSLHKTKLKTIYTCTESYKQDLGIIILK